MSKEIFFGEPSRTRVLNGIKKVYNAVKITMGPKGKNVLIQRKNVPLITNDGISVAKLIDLKDNVENMGVKFVQEAAGKTNLDAGDGTTLTTVLTYAMANEGMKYINNGINPFALSESMLKTQTLALECLDNLKESVSEMERVKQVATISAQSEEIGKVIADTIEKVGNDGVITVEEGKTNGITTEVTLGYKFNQGYISPYFVTDNNKMEGVINNPYIIITDKTISNIKDISKVIDEIMMTGRKDIVIIAEDITGDALTALVMNKMKGVINVAVVRAPSYGDNKKEMLRDIAAVTGGKVFSDDFGIKLSESSIEYMGQCSKFICNKQHSIIVGGRGNQEEIDLRVQTVKALMEVKDGDFDRFDLERRVAALAGGVAVIRVGAGTEMEMQNKRLKVEDALNATKAAIQEGVVAGGGTTLVNISEYILSQIDPKGEEEQVIADKIISAALLYPIKQICENAGYSGDVAIQKIKSKRSNNFGFNAKIGKFCEMVESGIIDPAKVVRCAIENSISASMMLLTLDAVVVEEGATIPYTIEHGNDLSDAM